MSTQANAGSCPRCTDSYLERTYLGPTVVMRCEACMGHWFGRGELAELFKSVVLSYLSERYAKLAIPAVSVTGPAQCPTCRIALRRARPTQLGNAAVDVCARCGGTWLDGQEFIRALKHQTHSKGWVQWILDTIDQVTSTWQTR